MINHKITTHICSNCLNNINKGKRPQYQVPSNISRNKMILSVTKLTRSVTISKNLSYQQIAQWELLHKSKDFSINIFNLFFKVVRYPKSYRF
jgi:hypothetical protein